MTIYRIAEMLTGLFETIMSFYLFETFCKKKDNISKRDNAITIVAVTILVNISNHLSGYGILNAVGMTVSFFMISFLFRGSFSIKLIISIVSFLMLLMAEVVILFGMTFVFNVTVTKVVDIPQYRLLGIIASKMLAFLIINAVRLRYKDKNLFFRPAYWLLFLIIFSTTVIAEFLMFKLSYELGDEYLYTLSIACAFGLLFSTFFTFYLYEHLAKQAETIRIQGQYELHLKTQLKHLDDILITQKQIKKFKHDFNNYLIGLKGYIKEGDMGEVHAYIRNLEERFNQTDGIIETGNTSLDAIISTKIAIAESKGIKVNTKIQIPEDIPVEPIDMCIIFGNALDNAIEACERIETENKRISITILCRDETVLCKIVNTVPKSEKTISVTSKSDKNNHGFGLDNIKTALEKYNSIPKIEKTDTEFILKFVIFTK